MKKYSNYDYVDGLDNLIYLHPNNDKVWGNTAFIREDELPFGEEDDQSSSQQEIHRPQIDSTNKNKEK